MKSQHINKFVLNLEDRKDRRIDMERQLSCIGWRAQFSGSKRPVEASGFPSIGARGCFESHLSQLKRGIEHHVILMEDDLNFAPNFPAAWCAAIAALEATDWSIFYPAHGITGDADGLALIAPDVDIVCAHFVMFHKKVVPLIIAELEAIHSRPPGDPRGGPMHVDGAYQTIRRRHPEIKTYAFLPSLGYQRSSRSDIARGRFFDRIPALQPAMGSLRRLKNSKAL